MGMDANAKLFAAIRDGNVKQVTAALARGADPLHTLDPDGQSPLHAAASAENLEILDLLLKASGKRLLNRFDALGRTPLMRAVENKHVEAVRKLIAAGADVNARQDPRQGDSALRLAATDGPLAISTLLIDAGANPLLPGRLFLTPLDRARQRNSPEGRLMTAMMMKVIQTKAGKGKR
jgi:euchromatic histone-lysine N-methyltransferase